MNLQLDIPQVQKELVEGGSAYGYSTLDKAVISELIELGVTMEPGAPIRLSIPALNDRPDPDLQEDWVFVMWETPALPPAFIERHKACDFILVPCNENKRWFKNAGISCPIYVCHLAMDSDFTYRRRELNGEPLRFLWVGAFTARKQWRTAARAFEYAFGNDPSAELYIKTSKVDDDGEISRNGNMTLDTRKLTREELKELYYTGHVFLHTCGLEGWGLTPLEAMATGALVISPSWAGLKEFVNKKTAEVVNTVPVPVQVEEIVEASPYGREAAVNIYETMVGKTDIGDLIRIMRKVCWNYPSTERKRKYASDFAHNSFSWRKTAQRIVDLITEKSRVLN